MVRIKTERNPDAAKMLGTYRNFGGNPSKGVEDSCKCPSCGSNGLKDSPYIGMVYCEECNYDYPVFLTIEDPKEATRAYITYFGEVRSNDDYLERYRDLKGTYRGVWMRYVSSERRSTIFRRIFNSNMYKLWMMHVHKYKVKVRKDPADIVKDSIFPNYAMEEFFSFIKTDPFFEGTELISIKTSKKDLIDKMSTLEEENYELKERLNSYGL